MNSKKKGQKEHSKVPKEKCAPVSEKKALDGENTHKYNYLPRLYRLNWIWRRLGSPPSWIKMYIYFKNDHMSTNIFDAIILHCRQEIRLHFLSFLLFSLFPIYFFCPLSIKDKDTSWYLSKNIYILADFFKIQNLTSQK